MHVSLDYLSPLMSPDKYWSISQVQPANIGKEKVDRKVKVSICLVQWILWKTATVTNCQTFFPCCLDLEVYCYWLSSLTQVPRETNYSNPKSMQNGFERLLSMVRNVLFSLILVSLITSQTMLKWNSFNFVNLANNWLQQRIGLYHLERAKLGKRE